MIATSATGLLHLLHRILIAPDCSRHTAPLVSTSTRFGQTFDVSVSTESQCLQLSCFELGKVTSSGAVRTPASSTGLLWKCDFGKSPNQGQAVLNRSPPLDLRRIVEH